MFCSPTQVEPMGSGVTECMADALSMIPHVVFIIVAGTSALVCWCKCRNGIDIDSAKQRIRLPGHDVRWILTLTLMCIHTLELLQGILSEFEEEGLGLHLYVPPGIAFIALIASLFFYDFIEVWNVQRLLSVSLLYWCGVLSFVALKLSVLYETGFTIIHVRVMFSWMVVVLAGFVIVMEFFVLKQQHYWCHEMRECVPAEEQQHVQYIHSYTNFISHTTWHWLNPMLKKGYQQPLEIVDLGNIPKTEHSKTNFDMFKKIFEEEKSKAEGMGTKPSLWKTFWRAYWPMMVLGGVYKLLADHMGFVPAMCLDGIITFLEDRTETPHANVTLPTVAGPMTISAFFRNGYTLTLVSLIAGILQGVLFQNSFFLSVRQGIRCKGAIQSLVFDKTLKLSTWSLSEGGMTPGQVMNHMAIDPMHIFMFLYFMHFIWSLPIQVLTTFILLYVQLGSSALISATFIMLLIPFQYIIGQLLSKAQKEILEQSDERLKKCNEVLQSIKLLKLYAWESIFRKSIERTRHRELRLLLRAAAYRVFSIFVVDGAPLAATLITFTIYPYIENKPLEAAKVFSSLALFNILSLPLYIVTMIMNIVAHARVSTNRLLPFLLAPEVKGSDEQSNGTDLGAGPIEKVPLVEVKNQGSSKKRQDSVPTIKIDLAPDIDQNADDSDHTEVPLLIQNGSTTEQKHTDTHTEKGLDIASSDTDVALEIKDGSFSWDLEGKEPVLHDINVKIPCGKLTILVGTVGSGKTSILSALLGEMTTVRGKILKNRGSNIAYGAQRAWLMNATLRDNILFGRPYDSQRYDEIIECCALAPDISVLPAGDQTEIGEKGINLSGGQKQRVSIARTLYADSSIVILDDPMSALDVHVGSHIFREAIARYLLQEEKTVILVTHQLQYMPYAHKILVMKGGRIIQAGSLKEIKQSDPDRYRSWNMTLEQSRQQLEKKVEQMEEKDLLRQSQHDIMDLSSKVEGMMEFSGETPIRAALSVISLNGLVSFDDVDTEQAHPNNDNNKAKDSVQEEKEGEEGQLIQQEERETGSVGLKVYMAYAHAATFLLTIVTSLGYAVRQVLRIATDYWLAEWSDAARDAAIYLPAEGATGSMIKINGSIGIGNVTQMAEPGKEFRVEDYVIPYVILCVVGMVIGLFIIFCLECMVLMAARNLHDSMLKAIINSPMRFFDTTPIGRIINRMAGDTNTIDEKMPVTLDALLFSFFYVLGGIVVNTMVMPYFLIAAIPMVIAFIAIQRFYIASCRELQRLDNISRSPIIAHFQETLGGLSTIRAYRDQQRFKERNCRDVDQNNTAFLYLHTANVWMGIRLDILGMIIVFTASVCSITSCLYGYTTPPLAGLAIAYAIMTCTFLNWMMRDMSETEMWFSSVQRVDHYGHLTAEPYHSDKEIVPEKDWPKAGEIRFERVSVRYDSSLDAVIHELCLCIKAGEKIGICGRTGSGKSSLTLGLFRLIDIFEGRILIDDIDISQVPLETLRSQLSIIPQDPVLFAGSVRFNLDPEGAKSDDEVWQALEIAQLKTTISSLPELLYATVAEGGENFSQGQRQLFCLARAFLRNSRILIMDEATASIDMETDALIQEVMQTAFKDRTVITIAHRVATILNSDTVIVLQNGQIIEHDKPENLLSTNSIFASMVHENK